MTGNACTYSTVAGPDPDAVTTDLLAPETDRLPKTEAVKPPPRFIPEATTDQHLDAAYHALMAGEYAAVFSEIEIATTYAPYTADADTVYLSGLLYADPDSPAADIEKAYKTLQEFGQEFPESERALEGRIISNLLLRLQHAESRKTDLEQDKAALERQLARERQKVKALNSMIEKMKKIDLEIVPTD
jgi:hypothetical protein